MREAGADGRGHPLPQEAHTLRRRDHQRMVRWIPSGKDNNGFAIKRDDSSLNLYAMLLFIDPTTVDFSLSPTSMQCCTGQCFSNVAGLSQATESCFCLFGLCLCGCHCFYKQSQDCPNGKLTPNTFCEMYKMFFPAGDADKFCENVFRTFDADKSGTIDFKVKH